MNPTSVIRAELPREAGHQDGVIGGSLFRRIDRVGQATGMEPVPATRAAVPGINTAQAGTGGLLATLLAWRERRFVADVARELLSLYRAVAARNPGLSGRALYCRVLAERNGGDLAKAEAHVEGAEQSFAIWPVARTVRFGDVVHFVAATEFMASHGAGRWIHADIKHVVATRIPREL